MKNTKLGEALDLMPPPPDVLMEDVEQWVRSGPMLLVMQKGQPLQPYEEGELTVLEDAGAAMA